VRTHSTVKHFGGIAVTVLEVPRTTVVGRITTTVVSGRGSWGQVAGIAVVAAFVVEVVAVGWLRTLACSLVVAIAITTAFAVISAITVINGLTEASSNYCSTTLNAYAQLQAYG